MDLSPYVESVRAGVTNAAALADDHTRTSPSAGRRHRVLDPTRAHPGPVGRRRHHQRRARPRLGRAADGRLGPRVRRHRATAPTPSRPCCCPMPTPEPHPATSPTAEPDDEPVARVTLRLPQSVKTKVDERADADGISTNAWLIRAVLDALADDRAARWWPPHARGARGAGPVLRPQRALRPARGLRPHGPFGQAADRVGGPSRTMAGAFPRERPGVGAMTFRERGVRAASGTSSSTTSAAGRSPSNPDDVGDRRRDSSINAADEAFLTEIRSVRIMISCGSAFPPGRSAARPAASAARRPGRSDLHDQGRARPTSRSAPTSAGPRSSAARATSPSARPTTSTAPPGRATSRSPGRRSFGPDHLRLRRRSPSARRTAR